MDKEKVIVAHIIGKWLGGGVESVVMNYYRNINRSKVQFDFICDSDSTDIPYEEIKKMGGNVIIVPKYQNIFKYMIALMKIFKEKKYKIIHSHINVLSCFPLFVAKISGVPVRIAHSHSTTNKKEFKRNIVKLILRPFSKIFATDYFACTEYAGKWMFGNKELKNNKIFILKNAIDLKKFKYDNEVRKKIRNELKIKDDTFVIGHIGRFVSQKNHMFILEIFKEILKENKNLTLVFVGKGPLLEDVKQKAVDLEINDNILFLGQRNDVDKLYQAFDLFLFPSLYEGLGMVLIEAQCSGLYCVTSTCVPQEAKVTNNIEYLSLELNPQNWAKIILKKYNKKSRKSYISDIKNKNYDISTEAKNLTNYYIKKY